MQSAGEHTFIEFQQEHTFREVLYYVFDFDSPPLTLKVRLLYHVLKAVWILLNILATVGSCLVLVLISMPEFYDEDTDNGKLVLDAFGLIELFCVLFFTVDYGIRMYLTPQSLPSFFIDAYNMIDLLTTVPYYIQLILAASNAGADWFRVIFLLRTFRMIKLARYHSGLEMVLRTLYQSADLLLLFLNIVTLIVIFAATVFYYAERGPYYDRDLGKYLRPCSSRALALDPTCELEVSPYQSIPDAMYWAIVTITTVGYRGQTPETGWGKAIAICTAMAGLLFFAAPATVLSTNYKLARRRLAATQAFKKIDVRMTAAMMAQERLKKEMILADRHRSSEGRVKLRTKRLLKKVATFTFEGFRRPIYEVKADEVYVYPPILTLKRHPPKSDAPPPEEDAELDEGAASQRGAPPEEDDDDRAGEIVWLDDFNPSTSQRHLSLLLVLDSDEARDAARSALVMDGIISRVATENQVLVTADPAARLEVRHDYNTAYPRLHEVVRMDQLENPTGYYEDVVPIRFLVDRPHQYPSMDVITLLKETRLLVTVATVTQDDVMQVPLLTDVIMASRFVRELSEIAYLRESDGALIAYIHHSDAAELLQGFSRQFMPTPRENTMVFNGYALDNQVLSCLVSSFPRVSLAQVPPIAANSFYRGQHLSVDLSDEQLLEVNLTALSAFDSMGFGHRFVVEVPVQTVERDDVQFQII